MKTFFAQYSRGAHIIAILLVCLNLIEYLFLQYGLTLIEQFDSSDLDTVLGFSGLTFDSLIPGCLLIVAGLLTNRFQPTKRTFLQLATGMLIAQVIMGISSPVTFWLGYAFFYLFFGVLSIQLWIHLAILFQVADSAKDNFFIYIIMVPNILFLLLVAIFQLDVSAWMLDWYIFAIPLFCYFTFFILLSTSDEIGYEINEVEVDEDEPEEEKEEDVVSIKYASVSPSIDGTL